ncbi:transcriptional repressor RstR [Shewanella sairae]|uniref:Transcriptional repressor RstR n=1 Tax=Shewanella sairae TaxID=190310 RepID=A0ABQ4PH54_9GAMM|nr:helix-turn-helix transcriptional regulator [Shewanella sairae]MCL1132506.1 helix-turn-helix domain-containing protein [Shewanella sairae]GIU46753.1 transcriptional repressor RstR [Shewanella sairae]GIU46770.1 transcriptional repressor RstR [Shewanella sairae]
MIGKKIRLLRESKNLRQEDVAKAIQVTKQTYYMWEKDETEPKVSQLLGIAKILGVSVAQICEDDEIGLCEDTKNKIIETQKLNTEEKKCLNMFIEAMLIRHYSKAINI